MVVSRTGRVLLANSRAETLFGYQRGELQDETVEALLPERKRQPHARHMEIYFASPQVRPMGTGLELFARRKDGSEFPVDIMLSPVKRHGDVNVVCIVRDVTERKQIEAALRKSEEQYRDLYEEAPVAYWSVGHDGRILRANRRAVELLAYALNDLVGRRVFDLYADTPAGKERAQEVFQRFQAGEEIHDQEMQMRKSDGTIIWVSLTIKPIRDSERRIVASRSIAEDITERKLMTEALRRYAERVRVLHEIDRAILAARSAEEIAQAAANYIRQLVPALRSSVTEIDLGVSGARVLSANADGETELGADTRLSPEALSIVQELLEGKVYVVQDIRALAQPSPVDRTLLAEGVRSYIKVPLLAAGTLMGTLNLGSDSPGAFPNEYMEIAREVGEQLAVAIHQARLFKQTQQRLQRLGGLHSIGMVINASMDLQFTLDVLLQQMTTQLGFHAADVLLLDQRTATLQYAGGRGFRTGALQHTQLRLGDGNAGRAALERRILSLPNLTEHAGDFERSPLLPEEGFVAYFAVPLIAKGQVKGVLEIFHRAALAADAEWLEYLETLAGQAATAIDNAELFEQAQRSNIELTQAYEGTLEGWVRALDLRDRETEGHTQRVTEMTLRLAQALGVDEAELVHVRRGALLHDIGKMGIPDVILRKHDPLTEEEWVIMRKHADYAKEWLSPIEYLRPALDIPYCHHEKWDGTGYPRGLTGEQIPLAARIFAVVDVWDALRSDRPYRQGWPEEKVREYIRAQAGTHFDPKVVELFLQVIDGNAHE